MAEKNWTNEDRADSEASPTEKGASTKNGNVKPNEPSGSGAENDATANLSLREQLEAARAERDTNYNLYLRSQAELQNYRKRWQKEAEEMRQYQALPVARDLLPALDNLHRALAAAESSGNVKDLVNGVRLVAKQIEAALGRHDVVSIDSVGKPFDPNLHQAIQQVQ